MTKYKIPLEKKEEEIVSSGMLQVSGIDREVRSVGAIWTGFPE